MLDQEIFPRYVACNCCCYPLNFASCRERLGNEKITEVIYGSVFGPEYQLLTGEEGLMLLERNLNLSSPFLEDKTAIGFTIVNDILIFNIGSAGDYKRYMSQSS